MEHKITNQNTQHRVLTTQLMANLQEYFWEQPWFGNDGLINALRKIDGTHLTLRPHEGRRNVAEFVLHLRAWRHLVIELLDQNPIAIETDSPTDWQVCNDMQLPNWLRLLDELEAQQHQILDILSEKNDDFLKQNAIQRHYSNDYLVRGMIQHDVYHLAQIQFTLKMLEI
ncbi:MAG: hypothetical protein RL757_1623 [Bacteroidota bacterium]|jgi:uncharacterized damage-inducible protein DinB